MMTYWTGHNGLICVTIDKKEYAYTNNNSCRNNKYYILRQLHSIHKDLPKKENTTETKANER